MCAHCSPLLRSNVQIQLPPIYEGLQESMGEVPRIYALTSQAITTLIY